MRRIKREVIILQRRNQRGSWNRNAYKNCLDCWRSNHKPSNDARAKPSSVTVLAASQISTLRVTKLAHSVFENDHWRESMFRKHPRLQFNLRLEGQPSSVSINSVADSGAQSNLWSYQEYQRAGFVVSDLQPVSSQFCVADRRPLQIVGAFKGIFEGVTSDGRVVTCRSLVYVSRYVEGFFLSYDTMLNLQVLDVRFPEIGRFPPAHAAFERGNTQACNTSSEARCEEPCTCPARSAVPCRPAELPFAAIPENIPRMRAWLLDRYAASTFNVCPHQPLQHMSGPPIEIHLDDNATPRVCHTAIPIPLHWQKQVLDDILRDEALGVIEKVPYGVPVTWCHRMVITRKHDGSPRRTVDLSPLNRFCRREAHSGESPFLLARRVPGSTWKTVSDAWNGYHSVPLRESDRHLTTFITPYGRYRYKRAPQGFLSSDQPSFKLCTAS